jgi:hypothetical protein
LLAYLCIPEIINLIHERLFGGSFLPVDIGNYEPCCPATVSSIVFNQIDLIEVSYHSVGTTLQTERMQKEGQDANSQDIICSVFFSKPHLPVFKFSRSLRAKKYITFVVLTDLPVYNKCLNKIHPIASWNIIKPSHHQSNATIYS